MSEHANPTQAKDAILAAISSGDLEAAREHFAAASERWRGATTLRLAEGSILEATDQLDAAEALYRELQEDFADNPWPGIRLARLLRRQGRLAEARKIFEDVIWASKVRSEIKAKLLDDLARSTLTDVGEATAFLERLQARAAPDDALVARLTAILSAKRGSIDEGLAALGAVAESEDSMALARDLLLRANRMDEARTVAQALVDTYPDSPQHIRRLVLLLSYTGKVEEAARTLDAALRRWPSDWRLIYRLNRLNVSQETLRSLFATITANRANAPMDARALLHCAIAALHVDDNEAAHEALGAIDEASPQEFLARPLRRALVRWPRGHRATPRFADDPSRALQIVRVPDAVATVFVFTGMVRGLSYLPLAYTDELFAPFPVNVVYLRDTRHGGYFKGVDGLGEDMASTAAGLRRLAAELGGRTITLGASYGGFAAVRFAALIGADATVSLAGATQLMMRRDPISSAELYFSLSQAERDIVPDIEANPDLDVFYYYGRGNASDSQHAERLAGLANCRVHGVDDVNDHLVVLHMVGSGAFERVLADDLGLSPAAL